MPEREVRRAIDQLVEKSTVTEEEFSLDEVTGLLSALYSRLTTAARLASELRDCLPPDEADLSAMTDRDREQASAALGELSGTLDALEATMSDIHSALDPFLS